MRLGSKSELFIAEAQSWALQLPVTADVTVEIGEMLLHLSQWLNISHANPAFKDASQAKSSSKILPHLRNRPKTCSWKRLWATNDQKGVVETRVLLKAVRDPPMMLQTSQLCRESWRDESPDATGPRGANTSVIPNIGYSGLKPLLRHQFPKDSRSFPSINKAFASSGAMQFAEMQREKQICRTDKPVRSSRRAKHTRQAQNERLPLESDRAKSCSVEQLRLRLHPSTRLVLRLRQPGRLAEPKTMQLPRRAHAKGNRNGKL
nr:BTB/POZ domain-containing protein At5g03250 [Ipomoea batatas]